MFGILVIGKELQLARAVQYAMRILVVERRGGGTVLSD